MEIIVKKGIKNGYVRVSDEGKILITLPYHWRNDQKLIQELSKKGAWLLEHHKTRTFHRAIDAEGILLFGERVLFSDLPSLSSSELQQKFLKKILIDYAQPLVDHYLDVLWYPSTLLRVRKVKTRRWSCSADNRIMLNLSLLHLPTKLIRYVIIHEVCHVQEKNHSSRFRNLVEGFCPEYKKLRKELKNQIVL